MLDNDGITDEPLTIALDLTIAGDSMVLDFSRSSAPAQGPINISHATTVAAATSPLKHVFTEVPANAGCLRPITFTVPETTLLGAGAPKPMAGYTETILRLIGVVLGALAEPTRTRHRRPLRHHQRALARRPPADGSRWVMFSFFGGASAATRRPTA